MMIATAALLVTAGCATRDRVNPGPDEFAVLPARPLAAEPAGAPLPAPAPAAGNLAAAAPFGDAVAALGGRPGAASPTLLGSQGARFRSGQRGSFLARFLGIGNAPSSNAVLDPDAEAARLRALGLPVTGG